MNVYALFSSEPGESGKQELKSKLAVSLIDIIRAKGWGQAEAGTQLKTTQPRISDLMRGKLDRFSVDALVEMLCRTGYAFNYSSKPGIPLRISLEYTE